jgi:formylglycine-generating enzyme required for sulfatase activity
VFDYCLKYAGTPYASRAVDLLHKLPPLVKSIGMTLAPVRPGTFLMGSPEYEAGRDPNEGPQHEVVITRPFYMGACEVTVGQFKAFVSDTGYQTEAEKSDQAALVVRPDFGLEPDPKVNWRSPGLEQTDDHPVVCVSWNDARAFCDWLSKKEGRTYDLPTEAQWEYACRAGSKTRFHFRDDEDIAQYAWQNVTDPVMKTHPVGQLKPNAWGLYDMHGNIWQWTADWFAADYYQRSPREDPPGPTLGNARVMRGGGGFTNLAAARSAFRYGFIAPTRGSTTVGFRVVLLR